MRSQKGRTQGRVAATLRKHNWKEKYLMGTENVPTDELCLWVVRISLYFCVFQERKKIVKGAQREKRKNKVPKHMKRRKEKVAKMKKGR